MGVLKGIADAFDEGGWGMWPILICAVLTIAIAVERAVYLYKSTVDKDKLLALMKSQIMSGNVQGAIKVCSGNPTPMTRIVQAGLMKFNKSDDEVQAAMDEAALRENPKIEQRTGYLALLANLAMLSGLLGTVTGLIAAFGAVATADAASRATMLAAGISEAMNCTAFGLLAAIIALIGFAVLNGKTQSLMDDINGATVQVMNLVVNNRSKINLSGVPQAA